MTHFTKLIDAPIPDPKDTWQRPVYDQLSELTHDKLLEVAWNMLAHYQALEGEALNLAQDLSCEFELCDYATLKPEFRHEESERRQAAGIRYMQHAYAIAGFTEEHRAGLRSMAEQMTRNRGRS